MAFEKKTWVDRDVENPNGRIIRDAGTGVETRVTVQFDEGDVYVEGDLLNAANFNNLENRIEEGFESIPTGTTVAVTPIVTSGVDIATIEVDGNPTTIKAPAQTKDTELVDVRTGADGTEYPSAGNAVRGQISDLLDVVSVDSLSDLTLFGNYYINNSNQLVVSSSWRAYSYKVEDYKLLYTELYGSGGSQKAIGFYSDTPSDSTFISGKRFDSGTEISSSYRKFTSIVVPSNAKYVLVTNRNASGLPVVKGLKTGTIKDLVDDVTDLNSDLSALSGAVSTLDTSVNGKIDNINGDLDKTIKEKIDFDDCYTSENCYYYQGNRIGNANYTTYFFDAKNIKIIDEVKANTNSSAYPNVMFFSDYYPNLNASTFISSRPCSSGTNTYTNVTIPTGTKTIAIMNKTDSYATPTAILTRYRYAENIDVINNNLDVLNSATVGVHQNVKHIYTDIWNANDFCIVGDEIWLAKPNTVEGVEMTSVRKYKIVNGIADFSTVVGSFTGDFGHWNCVDYCEATDCLIFGNGGNGTSTEGNWFAVVPNAKSLTGTVTLANVGVKYDVDMGYKVQAVWGDNNLGQYNIAIVFSNDARTLKKYLLLKDANGDFTGDKVEIDSQTFTNYYGVGGADYWGDTLYIGTGSHNWTLAKMSMTDYEVELITRLYYDATGTQLDGSMQGVVVDDKYVWIFFNIAGAEHSNYLIQYYR